MDWSKIAVAILGFLSLIQTTVIYSKNRKDKKKDEDKKFCSDHRADCAKHYEDQAKECQALRDRIGVVETRADGFDKSLTENREFYSQLNQRIDEIQRTMLTKDDLNLLVTFIKGKS